MTDAEPFTPTTEQVRQAWVYFADSARASKRRSEAEFDRWLAGIKGEPLRPVCTVHHIPDCSPMLNGCSLVGPVASESDHG